MRKSKTTTCWMIALAAGSIASFGVSIVLAADPGADKGLVGHWTFDALSAGGKTLADASGGKHAGHLTGPSVLVDGKLGKALKLAGPPEQVNLGDLKTRAPATVAFWFNTRELFSDRRILSQLSGPETAAGALRFDGGQIEVFDGKRWQLVIKWGLRFDTWHHVAIVFDSRGKATGYLDGKRSESAKSGFDFAGVQAAIGAKQLGKMGNPFIGCLDDFRVYSRALSAEQIRRLCSATEKQGGSTHQTHAVEKGRVGRRSRFTR
jgi:hypothetical protein